MSDLIISKPVQLAWEAWESAVRNAERADKERMAAVSDQLKKEKEFGRLMVPADAKVGERFSIWFLSDLLTVEKTGESSYKIEKRNGGVVKPATEVGRE